MKLVPMVIVGALLEMVMVNQVKLVMMNIFLMFIRAALASKTAALQFRFSLWTTGSLCMAQWRPCWLIAGRSSLKRLSRLSRIFGECIWKQRHTIEKWMKWRKDLIRPKQPDHIAIEQTIIETVLSSCSCRGMHITSKCISVWAGCLSASFNRHTSLLLRHRKLQLCFCRTRQWLHLQSHEEIVCYTS